jgi:hypothetical protein
MPLDWTGTIVEPDFYSRVRRQKNAKNLTAES